jgi:hypothetical protein
MGSVPGLVAASACGNAPKRLVTLFLRFPCQLTGQRRTRASNTLREDHRSQGAA